MSSDYSTTKKEVQTPGRPWAIHGKYSTHSEAKIVKEQLEEGSIKGDVPPKRQYKIKRMRDPECFVIKTRVHPDEVQEKTKSKKKKSTKAKSKKVDK